MKVGHFVWVRHRARMLHKVAPYFTRRECILSALRDAQVYF